MRKKSFIHIAYRRKTDECPKEKNRTKGILPLQENRHCRNKCDSDDDSWICIV